MLDRILRKVSFRENRRRYLNLKGIASRQYAYKGPDIVQIDLTDKCNSHCNVCWIHSPLIAKNSGTEYPELDYAAVKNFINELAHSGTKEIIFAGGGEPFLYPGIWDIFEHTQKMGLRFRLNTNFILLDNADIARLVSFDKLASITISIWAGIADIYSYVHNRTTEAFNKVTENLKILAALKRRHLEIKLYSVISNANYSSLKSVTDLALQSRCPFVEFSIFDVVPGLTDKFSLNNEQLVFLRKDFINLTKHSKGLRIINRDLFLKRISSPGAHYGEYDTFAGQIPCYAGWLFLRLRANGDFNSCLKSHRMPLGNIYKDSFPDVWNGPKQQEFRQKSSFLPRDWLYFGLMGNSSDGSGCRRMCDNFLFNAHIHGSLRYLFWVKH